MQYSAEQRGKDDDHDDDNDDGDDGDDDDDDRTMNPGADNVISIYLSTDTAVGV